MESYIDGLIAKYQNKGLIIDSNLLVLLIVGGIDRDNITRFRRTKGRFSDEDYPLLLALLYRFQAYITTPHILAEVSNLLGYLPDNLRQVHYHLLSAFVSDRLREESVAGKDVVAHREFPKFGITDTALLHLAPDRYLVATIDLPLYGLLNSRGVDAINFNHLRGLAWQL